MRRFLTALVGGGLCLVLAGDVWAEDRQPPDAVPYRVLETLERELKSVVQSVMPSVVTIRATHSTANNVGDSSVTVMSMSVGSGVLLDSTGLIMTSSRVVQGGEDFWVELSDERLYQGVLLGAGDDVAVLQIKGKGLRAAPFGEGFDLDVGSLVAAIGNSYGYSCGVSWGQVNGFRPDGTIQLALGVSAGNSGGALVNTRGRVVGLIKAKISEPFYLDPLRIQSGKEKIPILLPRRRLELPTSPVSLAIPIQTALRTAYHIIEAGTEPRAYVGVYVEDLTGWWAVHFKTSDGVLVTGVVSNTPADISGLKQGDVITAVDQQAVGSVRRFRQIVGMAVPGERMKFDLIRGGRPLKLVVEAGRAEMPHLGATDTGCKPYNPLGETHVARSQDVAVLPTSTSVPPVATENGPTGEDAHRSTFRKVTRPDWPARVRSLQRAIDSLQNELRRFQSEVQR